MEQRDLSCIRGDDDLLRSYADQLTIYAAEISLLVREHLSSRNRTSELNEAIARIEKFVVSEDIRKYVVPGAVTLKEASELGLPEPQSIRNKMTKFRQSGKACPKVVGKSSNAHVYRLCELLDFCHTKLESQ